MAARAAGWVEDQSVENRAVEILREDVPFLPTVVAKLARLIRDEYGIGFTSTSTSWSVTATGLPRAFIGIALELDLRSGLSANSARVFHRRISSALDRACERAKNACQIVLPPLGLAPDEDAVFRLRGLGALVRYVAQNPQEDDQ